MMSEVPGIRIFEVVDKFELPDYLAIILSMVSVFGIVLMVLALREYDLELLIGAAHKKNNRLGITDRLALFSFFQKLKRPFYLNKMKADLVLDSKLPLDLI